MQTSYLAHISDDERIVGRPFSKPFYNKLRVLRIYFSQNNDLKRP